jgi:hypothetical protein
MESKVNPILKLADAGRTVKGAGPIVKWEAYEVSAVFTFVVVQAQAAGAATQLALAAGASKRFRPTDSAWNAAGKVQGTGPALQPGPAVVYARAWIETTASYVEPYDWEVHVVLQ